MFNYRGKKVSSIFCEPFFPMVIQRLLWYSRYFSTISLLVSNKKCFGYDISFDEHEKVCVYIALDFQTSIICVPDSGNLHIKYTGRCLDMNMDENNCFRTRRAG